MVGNSPFYSLPPLCVAAEGTAFLPDDGPVNIESFQGTCAHPSVCCGNNPFFTPPPLGAFIEGVVLHGMCSVSEAGAYLRLIDFVYHSTLGLRVIKKKRTRWVMLSGVFDSLRVFWIWGGTSTPCSTTPRERGQMQPNVESEGRWLRHLESEGRCSQTVEYVSFSKSQLASRNEL